METAETAVSTILTNYGNRAFQHSNNSTNVVLVALPESMDIIRLVGDEEKHATLLFFGDKTTLPDEAKQEIILTLQQVSQLRTPFTERVVELSRLGAEEPPALVSMLEGSQISPLRDIIQVNPKIRDYLSNVEQFPKYIPHVTLGYPDYQGEMDIRKLAEQARRIRFDRLALWWGDEHFEFPLVRSFAHDGEMAEAEWSVNLVDHYLMHYGVKGQKWGITRRSSGGSSSLSTDASTARTLLAKPASSVSNTDIQAALNRMRLESQFKEVQAAQITPTRISSAKTYVKNLLISVGKEQTNRVAKAAAAVAIENALKGKSVDTKTFSKTVGKRISPQKSKKKSNK